MIGWMVVDWIIVEGVDINWVMIIDIFVDVIPRYVYFLFIFLG